MLVGPNGDRTPRKDTQSAEWMTMAGHESSPGAIKASDRDRDRDRDRTEYERWVYG